jgi:hypothetical protein
MNRRKLNLSLRFYSTNLECYMKAEIKQKNNKTSAGILIVIILFVVLNLFISIRNIVKATSPNGLGLSDELVPYESPSGKYSMPVSSKWTVFDLAQGDHGDHDVVTSISSPWSSIRIMVARKLFNTNLINDVVLWGREKANKSKLGYYETQSIPVSRNDNGLIIEYTKDIYTPVERLTWGSDNVHCYDAYFLKADYGYRFSYCSVEKVWVNAKELFLNLINSLEFDP